MHEVEADPHVKTFARVSADPGWWWCSFRLYLRVRNTHIPTSRPPVAPVSNPQQHMATTLTSTTTIRQHALTCSGHTRPVVDLAFSPVTPDGYFLVSACKGMRSSVVFVCAFWVSKPLLLIFFFFFFFRVHVTDTVFCNFFLISQIFYTSLCLLACAQMAIQCYDRA